MVRFPAAYRLLAAPLWRLLSPKSHLRRAFLRRHQVSAYAAASRRDYELMLVRYAPDVEVEYDPDFEPLGLGGTFRGHAGFLKFLETWGEAWGEWEAVPAMVGADQVDAVRIPFGPGVRLRTRRSFDERLLVRWPRIWPALARLSLRLLPRSGRRQALLRRAALSGWSAWARGDLELMLVRYAPDCLFESPPEYVSAGMRVAYYGHAGACEQAADLRESWEQMDITPLEVVDAGERFVILGYVHIRGRGSGAEWDSEIGVAYWLEQGLVVRQCPFFDWDEALRTAGIPAAHGQLTRRA